MVNINIIKMNNQLWPQTIETKTKIATSKLEIQYLTGDMHKNVGFKLVNGIPDLPLDNWISDSNIDISKQ